LFDGHTSANPRRDGRHCGTAAAYRLGPFPRQYGRGWVDGVWPIDVLISGIGLVPWRLWRCESMCRKNAAPRHQPAGQRQKHPPVDHLAQQGGPGAFLAAYGKTNP